MPKKKETNDRKDSMPDNKNSTVSDDSSVQSSPAIEDATKSPFSQESLAKIRERKAEPKQRKKRGPNKSKNKITEEDADFFIRPIFIFANILLKKYKIEPLNPQEIKNGVTAFTPLILKYFPLMGDYAIFIQPALWVGGILVARIDIDKPKPSTKSPEDRQAGQIENKPETV